MSVNISSVFYVIKNNSSFDIFDYNTNISNISYNDEWEDLYPIRESLSVVIPLTILYCLIFISGMLGNIITCIVISRNKSMHTATNYYLFSLAISDLLLLLSGMPLEVYSIWFRYPFPFSESVCIIQGFASETSANATVLTITAFTAERYIAICHPFLSHTMSKLSRAVKFVLGVWLLAMVLAVPQILDLGLTRTYDTCGIKDDARKHVFTISTILCFVFPMTVITVLYILIGLQLRRSRIVGRANMANGNSIRLKTNRRIPSIKNSLLSVDKDGKANISLTPVQKNKSETMYLEGKQNISLKLSNQLQDEGRKNFSHKANIGNKHVVNMLVAVVVAFFVCWAPHHAQRLFAMNADPKYTEVYDILTHISGILYFFSTCINPFLYNLMSYKFREAFKGSCGYLLFQNGNNNLQQKRKYWNRSERSNSTSFYTTSSACSGFLYQSTNQQNNENDISLLKFHKRPLTVKFKKIPIQEIQPPTKTQSFDYFSSQIINDKSFFENSTQTNVYMSERKRNMELNEDFNKHSVSVLSRSLSYNSLADIDLYQRNSIVEIIG